MESLLTEVVADLVDRYQPHAIMLYGSRARGDFSDTRDIDILCLVEDGPSTPDAREFHGVFLDAWIYPSAVMSDSMQEFLRVVDGYCLLDLDGQGAQFLQQVKDYFEAGPKRLSAAEVTHTCRWVNKMLEPARQQEVESIYRRYWLAVDLLQIYFDLRGHWYLGPKKSLSWLAQQDAIAYNLFAQVYSSSLEIEDLERLVAHVVNDFPRKEDGTSRRD